MDYTGFQSRVGILRSFHYPHYTLKPTIQKKLLRGNLQGKDYKTRIVTKYLYGYLEKKRIKHFLKDLL